MGLAHMMHLDRDAVICDFAETYRVYDIQALPARLAATLACGLKADSRIKMMMAGVKASPPLVLLGGLIVDEVRAFRYSLTGSKNDKPTFITEIMANGLPEKETIGFDSGADFEAYRQRLIERMNNG